MKVHGNKEHSLKRAADDELFRPVRLQSWFQDGKEWYWVVDESLAAACEERVHEDVARDVGEDADNPSTHSSSGNRENSQSELDEQIVEEIENWHAEA